MTDKTSRDKKNQNKDVLKGFVCPHCRTSQEFKALPVKGFKDIVMLLFWRYPIRCIRCLKSFYGPRRLVPHIKPVESRPTSS